MNVPDILGVEVLTPDGRGSILSLNPGRIIVHLHQKKTNQVMKGVRREELHYAYKYEDVTIIKGQYCFDDKRIEFQYDRQSLSENESLYSEISDGDFDKLEILTEHNTKVVASFMEHAKEQGFELPDELFESYFDA